MYCAMHTLSTEISMADETKSAVLTIRIRPSIKAKAAKRAVEEDRSLANYIEQLILQDTKRK
jgi:predicted HicB family RNase H-like nuclease